MVELKSLALHEILNLYTECESLREQVNKIVNEYGYTANDLTTRNFQQALEREYGKKAMTVLMKQVEEIEQ